MKEDLQEIKKSINSIKESIKTLEKHVLDDYYNEMAIEDVRMRLKIAEDKLSQLGYIYDTNIGLYGLYYPGCNVELQEKIESMYETSMKLVEDWNKNQVPPLSKCVPECYNK